MSDVVARRIMSPTMAKRPSISTRALYLSSVQFSRGSSIRASTPAITVLLVTESVPSIFTVRDSLGLLSVMVERKLNLPDMGPTLALMAPSKVVSSIWSMESSPGMQDENF